MTGPITILGSEEECAQEGDHDIVCKGEIAEYVSKSGATLQHLCTAHGDSYVSRMDALEADIQSRYPGYDTPGSPPPSWFREDYAGERWDED